MTVFDTVNFLLRSVTVCSLSTTSWSWLDITVYRDCEENKPLWTTLHLHEIVNLDELLNVSKVSVLPFRPNISSQALIICWNSLSSLNHTSLAVMFSHPPPSLMAAHSIQSRSRITLIKQTSLCPPSQSWAWKIKTNWKAFLTNRKLWTWLPSQRRSGFHTSLCRFTII